MCEKRRILRVFPRRTSYTPIDELVRIGYPEFWNLEVDEVHVSCVFSWDRKFCEELREAWSQYYPTKIGGPAYDCKSDGFIPGKYVKKGIIFTTRGCKFHCPWCLVSKIEGKFRELKNIAIGNVIQDNNILLANRNHLKKVFSMLRAQKNVRFVGGIDVRLLKDWHIENFKSLKIRELWLAFDLWDRERFVIKAIEKLRKAGFSRNKIRCYVLAGFDEPIQKAEDRLKLAFEIGALPFIQVYRAPTEEKRKMTREERLFVRRWSRPAIIKSMMQNLCAGTGAWSKPSGFAKAFFEANK